MRHIFLILLLLLDSGLLLAQEFASETEANQVLHNKYTKALQALESDKPGTALELFQEILAITPKEQNTLFYAGVAAERLNNAQDAIGFYTALLDTYPNDWQTMERLIVLYSSDNQTELRDKYRSRLYKLWQSQSDPELSERSIFLLDKFETEQSLVYVFNAFKMEGLTPILYKFDIYQPKERPLKDGPSKVISLGTYEKTNQKSKAVGEIGPNDRLFHLDGYLPDGSHDTYDYYKYEPSYDQTKFVVLDILANRKLPLSSVISPDAN